MLQWLDYSAIAVYFLLLLLIGFLTNRNESEEDFLIGNRAIKGFQTVASIGSSLVGAGMILSAVALVYQVGAAAIWLFAGYAFGFFIFYRFAQYLKPLADKYRFYTLPDYFYHRFGKISGLFAANFLLIVALGWIAVNFIGGGRIIESITNLHFNESTIIVAIIIMTYLLLGGFRAVVQTDVIQFIGLLILFGILAYLIFNYSVALTPQDYNIFQLPVGQMLSYFLVGILVPLSSGELWQRIYAVESLQTFKKSMLALSLFLMALGLVLIWIGLILRSQLPDIAPDMAIVEGFKTLLPEGWRGLAVVVFYSTIMSSADSYLFASATSLSRDILFRQSSKKGNKYLRWMILLLAILATLLAISFKDVLDVSFVLVSMMFALGFIIIYSWIKKSTARSLAVNMSFLMASLCIGLLTIANGISELLVVGALIGVFLGLLITYFIPQKNPL